MISKPGLNSLKLFFTSKYKWVTASSIVGYSWMNNRFMLIVRYIYISFFSMCWSRVWKTRKKIVFFIINFASFIANILSFSVGWELGFSNHSFQTPHVIHSINHTEGSFPKKILNLLLPTAWHCYGGQQRWNDASTLWFLWISDYSMDWFSPDR